jgi:hypothetical protein
MGNGVIDYTGNLLILGSPGRQFHVIDLHFINTVNDTAPSAIYTSVLNSLRTGAGPDIDATGPGNIDLGGNAGWIFGVAPTGEIIIYRDMPIIDGRVTIPPDYPIRTIGYFDFPGATIIKLSLGSGHQTGSKFGAQEFVRLVGITPSEWYSSDPIQPLLTPERVPTASGKIQHTYKPSLTLPPVKAEEGKRKATVLPHLVAGLTPVTTADSKTTRTQKYTVSMVSIPSTVDRRQARQLRKMKID